MYKMTAIILAVLMLPPGAGVRSETPDVGVAINPMQVEVPAYLPKIALPPGFSISLFASGVEGARSLAVSPAGIVYVGTLAAPGKAPYGKVYAVKDSDQDYIADEVYVIAADLNLPNGVAYRDGSLYVAEVNRILRFDDIEADLAAPPAPEVIYDGYPTDSHHGWKFIRFGPDARLYVPVGAPCNICEVADPYATITRIHADGGGLEIYARGVRNSVGFDWHPISNSLWFTDNGRDMMGNDTPPDELNHAPVAGLDFGFPYRYGKAIVDPAYSTEKTDFTPPALELPAHVAALGMRFYSGEMFPARYRHAAIIALHGSWNRNPPQGYSVAVAEIQGDKVTGYGYLAEGWLQGEQFWGRPVDVEQLADGSVLVSDDFNGVIYRITYDERRE